MHKNSDKKVGLSDLTISLKRFIPVRISESTDRDSGSTIPTEETGWFWKLDHLTGLHVVFNVLIYSASPVFSDRLN